MFGQMIVDELFVRAYKTSRVFPIPCLIIKLYKLAKVLIIAGVDNNVKETMGQYIYKIQDDTKFELRAHKPQSFGLQSQTTLENSNIPISMPFIIFY